MIDIDQAIKDARRDMLKREPAEDYLHDWLRHVQLINIPRYQVCQGHVSP